MTPEQRQVKRYVDVVQLVIFLIGVVFILLGINLGVETAWGSVLINVGSDIVVVSLLFFLGRVLLTDTQPDVVNILRGIEKQLLKRFGLFLTRDELNSRQSHGDFIQQARKLYVGGIGLRATRQGYLDHLRDRLDNGAHLRFGVLDPESPDVAFIAEMWNIPAADVANSLRAALSELKQLRTHSESQRSGSVEIRCFRHEPEFSFTLRDPDGPNATLRVQLRVYKVAAASRPAWELRPTDKPWFRVFMQAVEKLWQDSKPCP
ncbi:MAG: hypothetical protein AB1791_21345 [Chloroflexota bacterium]